MSTFNVAKKANFYATECTGTTNNATASEKYYKHQANHC